MALSTGHSTDCLFPDPLRCLVLGRPNSGCSTFLKAITNKRESYISVGGDVVYQGIGWKEMAKTFPGEVVYNMEGEFCVSNSQLTNSSL
jgi:ABC-type multidrug transport system ATPase subunit